MPTLQEVDDYPLPELLVPRVAKEHGFSQEKAARIVKEAKRMLHLSVAGDTVISPSEIVDHGWHAMLMFTRFYQDFCTFIGRFVHHNPTPGPPDGGRTYANTKKRYEEVFGEKPDPEYWP